MTAKTILIVKDDKASALTLATHVKSAGYRVVAAPDAITAMALAVRELPALIVLDMNLPAGGGMAVLDRINSLVQLAGTPIIVITANPKIDKDRLLAEGVRAFFWKPFDQSHLVDAIRHELGDEANAACR